MKASPKTVTIKNRELILKIGINEKDKIHREPTDLMLSFSEKGFRLDLLDSMAASYWTNEITPKPICESIVKVMIAGQTIIDNKNESMQFQIQLRKCD
ncbi:MAG: hypothetical protein ABIS36_18570 [Chryseolinea sp.]